MTTIDAVDPDGTITTLELTCTDCDSPLDLADPSVVFEDRLRCGPCAAITTADLFDLAA